MSVYQTHITVEMIMKYMNDDLCPALAHDVDQAIENNALSSELKAAICGSFKATHQNGVANYTCAIT